MKLQHILLLQRNVPRAAKYYSEGVGLTLTVLTENWAELQAGSTTIALKHVNRRANPIRRKPDAGTALCYCRAAEVGQACDAKPAPSAVQLRNAARAQAVQMHRPLEQSAARQAGIGT